METYSNKSDKIRPLQTVVWINLSCRMGDINLAKLGLLWAINCAVSMVTRLVIKNCQDVIYRT